MRRGAEPIKYAVVGLGHIAQGAVLPAFAHAKRNSRLAALVSDEPAKRRSLSKKYGVRHTFSYDDYEDCLAYVDAVYIALPNSMHAEYAIRAANAGVHVLCEKPMAVTVDECEGMIEACRKDRVKLMIAYRLHFEEINLKVADLVRRGRIGDPKFFNSSLTVNGRTTRKRIGKRDQFAPELVYFSDCILANREPEPSGEEGMQDVRIVEALYESAETGKAIAIPPLTGIRGSLSDARPGARGSRGLRSRRSAAE